MHVQRLFEEAVTMNDQAFVKQSPSTRRQTSRGLLLSVFFACIHLLTVGGQPSDAQQRSAEVSPRTKPNLLVIFTDDHGWADLGAQGVDPDIRTPHTDQLARDGVRFTRGYVTGPQCVPSRAGIITGTHQNRFGVDDNLKGPLPLEVTTLPERLHRAGYINGMSGKWHLDLSRETKGQTSVQRVDSRFLPHAHGFDEYWCGAMRNYHASHTLDGTPLPNAPQLVEDARFRITVQTEAALAFLDRRARSPDQPWFLYLPWFAPHVPLESPEPWFSRTPAHLPRERRQALAMIAAMDDGVAALRAKIREMGQEQNTLIFFISDNGAPVRPGAWDGSLNLPLIGEKGMLTDGGVRVPFVAAWPGTIPAGQVFDHPVSALDVAATAVALAGLPHDDQLDGVDLMPHLLGKNDNPPHDALYWRWRSQAAVLEFPWKLIHLGEKHRFLFDVTEPEGETVNLIEQHPEIAARLDKKLQTWQATLHRPGSPEPFNTQDQQFFDAHVFKTASATPRPHQSEGGIQGWLTRNGTAVLEDGGLVIVPANQVPKAARPFLVQSGLDLPGPVTATVILRAQQAGEITFAWRTRGERDFHPENKTTVAWTAGDQSQTVETQMAITGRLIHLRLQPSSTSGLRLQRITLRAHNGKEQSWNFTADVPGKQKNG